MPKKTSANPPKCTPNAKQCTIYFIFRFIYLIYYQRIIIYLLVLFILCPVFEVIEIELLDNLSNNSIFGNQRTNFTYSKGFSIGTANILKDVEKSYDKGKFLLEESKKSDAWDAILEGSRFGLHRLNEKAVVRAL